MTRRPAVCSTIEAMVDTHTHHQYSLRLARPKR